MKTVILCGGYGTRIRGVDDNLPKPMIPIGDMPILWHIMNMYALRGHTDFLLCLGYKGDRIRQFFLDYRNNAADITVSLSTGNVELHECRAVPDWSVTLAETGHDTMTGGRVRRVRKYLDSAPFMLTYGDGLGDIDIDALLAFHRSHGKTLTVTGVRPPGRFGELEVDRNGAVTGFNEKHNAQSGLISGGFFVCNPSLFDYLDGDDRLVFEREPMDRLVAAGEIMVYEHRGFWQPMDTYREFTLLNDLYKSGTAPWIPAKKAGSPHAE